MDSEATWNAVFGPCETPDSIRKACEDQNITPQDFTKEAIRVAIGQGFEGDPELAFANLCGQLDVDAG